MKRLKIAFCTQNIAPFRMKWIDELAKEFDICVFHLNEYEVGLNKKYISYKPKRAKIIDVSQSIIGQKFYRMREINAFKPDIFLLDGYGFIGQQILIVRLWMERRSFIMSVDGGFINWGENYFIRLLKRFFISKASAYFSTSLETDKYIDFYGGKDKIKYRHLFSNVSRDYLETDVPNIKRKDVIRQKLHMGKEFSIVSVGKFEYRKGFDLLMKALEQVDSNVKVYFIGASNKDAYIPYINDRNQNKIEFVNFCNQETLKSYYLASDCMILPTRYDIWGLVIAEAMANGIPVITTDKCLAGVAMLEFDELIPTENVESIVTMINKCITWSEKQKEEIGRRNIAKVQPYLIEVAAKEDIESIKQYYENYGL